MDEKRIRESVDPQALRALRRLLDRIEQDEWLPEHAMHRQDDGTYTGLLADGRTIVVSATRYDDTCPEHRDPAFWECHLEESIVWIQ